MKTNDFDADSHDPLWDLLGKAQPVKVSPFFARNVLREIRLVQPSPRRHPLSALLLYWRSALMAACVATLVLGLGNVLFHDRDNTTTLVQQPGDVEIVNQLDELLAYENNKVWLDSNSSVH